MRPRRHCLLSAFLVAFLFLTTATSKATDYFLTIGGGYSPTGNQVSLEKNVFFFQRLLEEQYPGGVPHHVLFSDGNHPNRDLQYYDPEAELPKSHQLLARVFRSEKYLNYQYRNHQIPNLAGGSTRQNIESWFEKTAKRLTAEDRVIIYVTAHGGKSTDKKAPRNTGLYVWNRQKLQMKELATQLDKLPPEVPVLLVMVQCYSGGFANIVFEKGEEESGVTRANRCGFFATVHDRPAAGCTPDIAEENYQEYSSYFWAAMGGKTRLGEAISQGDYDGDGRVSFAEAHAYALLTSTTIDISVKTSDAFLRHYSRTQSDKDKETEAKAGDSKTERPPAPQSPDQAQLQLLTADSPYPELRQFARPEQLAVLEGLSIDLKIDDERRATAARKAAAAILKEKKQVEAQLKKVSGELNGVCQRIRGALQNRWPELANRYHPMVNQLLDEQAPELVKMIESHPQYGKMQQLAKKARGLSTQRLDLDRRWARTQRLLRELENVALAANLPQVAPTEMVERYEQLVAAEHASLGPKP